MAILVLRPRDYANLLENAAMPHRSLKVRREIEKLRSKKRAEHRIQINLNEEDANEIAGRIYTSDLSNYETPEAIRERMEFIARMGVSEEGMTNNSYVGYSNSEWKAMIEIASGLQSEVNLKEIPEIVYYDLTQNYDMFEPYMLYMVGRSYGYRSPTELEDERGEDEEESSSAFAAAFGVTDENGNQTNGD
jgi:hypothetical protein